MLPSRPLQSLPPLAWRTNELSEGEVRRSSSCIVLQRVCGDRNVLPGCGAVHSRIRLHRDWFCWWKWPMTLQLGLSKVLPPICFNAGPKPMGNFLQLLRKVEPSCKSDASRASTESAELGASTMARDHEAAAPCSIEGVSSCRVGGTAQNIIDVSSPHEVCKARRVFRALPSQC